MSIMAQLATIYKVECDQCNGSHFIRARKGLELCPKCKGEGMIDIVERRYVSDYTAKAALWTLFGFVLGVTIIFGFISWLKP